LCVGVRHYEKGEKDEESPGHWGNL
jgi:hypothetical protein